MTHFLRCSALFLGMLLVVPAAFACSCANRTPAELYKSATMVFAGTVMEQVASPSIARVDVHFHLTSSWKGTTGDELWLATSDSTGACGVLFQTGQTYIVFAHKDDEGIVRTTQCDGTQELSFSSDVSKYLQSLTSSSSSSRSSSSTCAPLVCPSGKTYQTCTSDGHPIYYFAYPCQFDTQTSVFTDVPSNHPYASAIQYVKDRVIVSGYSDGSFHPDDVINRAEFTKIIIGSKFSAQAANTCDPHYFGTFTDTDSSAWYAKPLCLAFQHEIISGYPDGTFRPGNSVNFAEAAKIIAGTFNLPQLLIYYPEWWQGPIQSLSFALPPSYHSPDQFVTRGEMAYMIKAVLERNGGSSSSSRSSRSSSSSSHSATAKDGCKIGGCSAQLCVDQYDSGISTCEWTPAYACYQSATCERQPNGQCAWTQTSALTKCLNNAR